MTGADPDWREDLALIRQAAQAACDLALSEREAGL